MHIAYSAIRQISSDHSGILKNAADELPESLIRYQAYEAACQKLNKEIIAIQKYIPGWMPAFR